MFEYTALVDAPVKRFTSIVTDPEPDEAPVIIAIASSVAPGAMPAAEAPTVIIAIEPEARPEPVATLPALAPAPAAPAPRVVRTFVPRAEPAPAPSIVPALIGIAAAGVTAFWWMRRESHGRGR